MKYTAKKSRLVNEKSACVIVAIAANKRLDEEAKQLDNQYQGIISAALKNGDMSGSLAKTLLLHTPANSTHKRILLVGTGKPNELDMLAYKKIVNACASALKSIKATDVCSTLGNLVVKDQNIRALTRMHILLFTDNFYRYDHTLSKKNTPPALKRITFICASAADVKNVKQAIVQGHAIAQGMITTKELGNLPANICTPTYLANRAKQIKRGHRKLSVEVLDEAAMKKLGMGLLEGLPPL